MSKVTISDFAIALFELAEAEGKNLQESVRLFLTTERQALENTAVRSGLAVALTGAAIISLLAALGFFTWGVYVLSATFIAPLAAPFITGAVWLLISLIFMLIVAGKKSNGNK